MTFTAANWNTPQTVTVTGVDDDLDDGDVAYTIVTAAAVSADANYNGLNAADVAVTNTGQRHGGDHRHADERLITTEAGGTATFTIVLDTQPTADVTIGCHPATPPKARFRRPALTFTAANWNTPRP